MLLLLPSRSEQRVQRDNFYFPEKEPIPGRYSFFSADSDSWFHFHWLKSRKNDKVKRILDVTRAVRICVCKNRPIKPLFYFTLIFFYCSLRKQQPRLFFWRPRNSACAQLLFTPSSSFVSLLLRAETREFYGRRPPRGICWPYLFFPSSHPS